MKFFFSIFLLISIINFSYCQENSSDRILRYGIELDIGFSDPLSELFEASTLGIPSFGARLESQKNDNLWLTYGVKYSRIKSRFREDLDFLELSFGLMIAFSDSKNSMYLKPSIAPGFTPSWVLENEFLIPTLKVIFNSQLVVPFGLLLLPFS